MIDMNEFVKRAIKYLIEGIVVAIVAYSIPKKTVLNVEEVVVIGLSAAMSFALLDLFSPSISQGARSGAGAGIGLGLVGGVPIR
jgi:hypothetical protein